MFAPRAGGAAGGDVPGPQQWFESLPIITKYWFGTTVALTVAANVNVIKAGQLYFLWKDISTNFELWRLLTSFCYAGPFSFPTLLLIYMLVSMSQNYETGGPFNTGAGGGTADYAFMLIFGIVVIAATYSFLGVFPLFTGNLVYYVVYVWSKRNPTQQASIWGIPMQAIYLPFALLILKIVIGDYYMDMVHGIGVGHLYYYLVDVVPQVFGRDILVTPQFLINQFGVGHFYQGPAPTRPQNAGGRPDAGPRPPGRGQDPGRGGGNDDGHQWGTGGQRLGRG